jgi:hypothetical protein
MSDSFKKIKCKFLLNTALFSCLLGLCAAMFSVGAVLLILKLCQLKLALLYYILIGGGAFLIVFAVWFLTHFPTNKKIAKHLDENYGLGERVQTMLEFSGVDSDLTIMQREEAAERLAALKAKRPTLKKVLCSALCVLVSVGMLLAGVLVPEREKVQPVEPDEPEEQEPDFEITNWQVTALNQLMDEVNASDLDESVKTSCVATLQSLLDGLQEKQTESVMKVAVRAAITLISGIMDGANSYSKICTQLQTKSAVSGLSTPISSAVIAYRADGTSISQLSQVEQISATLSENISPILSEGVKFLSDGTVGLRGNNLTNKLKTYTEALTTVLADSGVAETDGLYGAVSSLNAGFNTVISSISVGGYTVAALQNLVVVACNGFATEATEALSVQAYNYVMGDYINARLVSIFDISDDADDNTSSDDQSGGEEEKNSSGGYGDKNENYGSDDLIFYPDEETYVKYGEVLDAYFAKMQEIISNGDLSEELVKYIGNYFDILYSGLQTDTDESQENQQNLQDGN